MNLIEQLLFGTTDSIGELILRLTLAIAIFAHGAQKVLGWFGGPGLSKTYTMFTQQMNIPVPLSIMAIATEFLAPFFLVVGFMTRPAALVLVILMVVAMSKHIHNGFFINWFGSKKGEGIEYHLLYIGAALALFFIGAGSFSVDSWLASRF